MTLQQCKYVLKIAQCGSFNEAAKQLFVAQSSLSVSVKALEQELNIRIFDRSGNGIFLTEEGAEFARYARQITEQNDFVLKRYTSEPVRGRLSIATQHYDFVAETFGKLLNQTAGEKYLFSLREMRTYDVIFQTERAYADIGVIAIKGSDYSIMERYLTKNGLEYTQILRTKPHVFLRESHPLAREALLTDSVLKDYPYVAYEQGEHSASFFTEEIKEGESDKQVEITDRATLMNVLLNTDCYTIGTGIMPSQLNMGRIVSIPYESDDFYSIGYLLRGDRTASEQTKTFIRMLRETAEAVEEERAET